MPGEIELPTLIQRILIKDGDLARAERASENWEQGQKTRMKRAAAATDDVTAAEQDLAKATDQGTAANENRRRSYVRDQPVIADRLRTEIATVHTQQEAIRLEYMAARQRAQENADLRARTALIDAHVASLSALERQAGGTANELARMDAAARTSQAKKLGFGGDLGALALGAGMGRGSAAGGGRGGIGGIFGAMRGASDKGKSLGVTALGTLGAFTIPSLIAGMSVLVGIGSALTGGLVLATAAMAPMVGYAASIATSMIATKTAIPLFKQLTAPANALAEFMGKQQSQRQAFMTTNPNAKQLAAFNTQQQKALTFQEAQSNLTPTGIAYAGALNNFQNNVMQPIQNAGQDALFPHLIAAFKEIMPLMPTITTGIKQIADAIGGVIERFAKMAGSAPWIKMIGPLMKQDAAIVANFGHTLSLVADAFLRVLYSAMPLVRVMQAHQLSMATGLDNWVKTAQAAGKLSGFFEKLAGKAGGFTSAMGQFFQALLHIGEIANRVNSLSKPGGFLHIMTRFNDYTKSGKGIESIYHWLLNSRAVLHDMGQFLGSIIHLLSGFGSQGGGVDQFFRDLNSTLIPALQQLKNSMGGWIPILLHAIVELLAAAAKLDSTFTFKPIAQLADTLFTLANGISELVRQIPGLYSVLSYGLSGLLVAKWVGAIGKAAGVSGLVQMMKGGSAATAGGEVAAAAVATGGVGGMGLVPVTTPLFKSGLAGRFQAGRDAYAADVAAAAEASAANKAAGGGMFGALGSFGPLGPLSGVGAGVERVGAAAGALRKGAAGLLDRGVLAAGRASAGMGRTLPYAGGLLVAGLGGGALLRDNRGGVRDTAAAALQGAGTGGGLGIMVGGGIGALFGGVGAGPGAAIGGAVGTVGGALVGVTAHLMGVKTAAEKQHDAFVKGMADEKASVDALGSSLADAIQADGFQKGAAYSDTLFQSLKQTPGAIHDMAAFGITLKNVQGYLDGNKDSTQKVTSALDKAGPASGSLRHELMLLAQAQRQGITGSDDQAFILGQVSQHMSQVRGETANVSSALVTLGRIRANPSINIDPGAALNAVKAVMGAIETLIGDVAGPHAATLAALFFPWLAPGGKPPGARTPPGTKTPSSTTPGWLGAIGGGGAPPVGPMPPISRPLAPKTRNALSRNALGGSVLAHMPTWVGERGPEIFDPASNGRILNHQQAAGMGGGSTSYATSFNFYGTIVASDIKAVMRQAARMAQNAALTGLAPDHAMALSGLPT